MQEPAICLLIEILICSLITLGLLLYYARKDMNKFVFFTAFITWLMNFVLVILLPFDIYYTQTNKGKENNIPYSTGKIIEYGYGITYWSLFILSWIIIPLLQSYESSGEFTKIEKLKSSLRENLIYYSASGIISLIIFIVSITKYGFTQTFSFFKDCSLIFGILFFFFLLSYSLIKYPKTLYENIKLKRLIKYFEWRANQFFEKLEEVKYDLINKFITLRVTIDNIKEKDNQGENKYKKDSSSNNKNSDKDSSSIKSYSSDMPRQVKDYLTYMEKIYEDFDNKSSEFGISLGKEKPDDMRPITKIDDLIKLNRKINKKINDSLKMQCRIRNVYRKWAILNTVLLMTGNNIDEKKDKNIINNNIKAENNKSENLIVGKEKDLSLEQEGFIPLDNFSKFKLFYYSKIKIFLSIVLFILCILAAIFIIFGEILLLFNSNLLYLMLERSNNIFLIHFIILLPLLYLICMSNYTLFKIRISSYIYMYGHRQTSSVSLLVFSSYLSRIYFAICLNFLQILNRFKSSSKSKFEIFFNIKQDKLESNFIIKSCRFSPILLFVCIFLFILNVPGKIGASVGFNLFEFKSEERDISIRDGHKYLMNLNKKLKGEELSRYDPIIFKDK